MTQQPQVQMVPMTVVQTPYGPQWQLAYTPPQQQALGQAGEGMGLLVKLALGVGIFFAARYIWKSVKGMQDERQPRTMERRRSRARLLAEFKRFLEAHESEATEAEEEAGEEAGEEA